MREAASAPKPLEPVTRGHSRAPAGLGRFITLVNAERLYERSLPDLKAIWRTALYEASVRDFDARGLPHRMVIVRSEVAQARLRAVREVVKTLRPETRLYLGPPDDDCFLRRWYWLECAGILLPAIARRNREGQALDLNDGEEPLELPLRITRGPAGQCQIEQNLLAEALAGQQLDHIRACAVCQRLFWAPRVNSECCREKCRKAYNQRNSRLNRNQKGK